MGQYLVVAAPDSFKGAAESTEICDIIEKAAMDAGDVEVIKVPLADGGEGTVKAYLSAIGGEVMVCSVTGPDFEAVEAAYGILPDGTAVIEMAQASGLTLTRVKNPLYTTTLGTGELVRDALDRGVRRFIIGIGGSATSDGGIGMAAALGAVFTDRDGKRVKPDGKGMGDIVSMDLSQMDERIFDSDFLVACDVNNPLYGKNGAAYIYGPQKGADEDAVELLDGYLEKYAEITSRTTGKHFENVPGAGAAGGLGYGLMVFLDAKLESGIELLLDAAGFGERLVGADLVITGEGRLDRQSLMGKTIFGISERCRQKGVPVVALAGAVEVDQRDLDKAGITAAFSIQRGASDLETAILRTKENMLFSAGQAIRFMKGIGGRK